MRVRVGVQGPGPGGLSIGACHGRGRLRTVPRDPLGERLQVGIDGASVPDHHYGTIMRLQPHPLPPPPILFCHPSWLPKRPTEPAPRGRRFMSSPNLSGYLGRERARRLQRWAEARSVERCLCSGDDEQTSRGPPPAPPPVQALASPSGGEVLQRLRRRLQEPSLEGVEAAQRHSALVVDWLAR
jgi:hypothetical protein